MRPFLLLSVISLGLLISACGETSGTCDELDCDDGNECTQDSCDSATVACENIARADWAPCDFDGSRGACHTGVCAELEWPADDEEHQDIKALCQARSIAECEDDARCAYLSASLFDPTLVCLEDPTNVGCGSRFRVCGLSITTGENPQGDLYRFSDTCLPKNWAFADNDLRAVPVTDAGSCDLLLQQWPTDEVAQTIREECEALNGGQCGGGDDCRTIFPFRVDESRMCLEISSDHEVCTSRFRTCDPRPTVARTPEEESFVLGNDCVLESWEITGSMDDEQSHIFAWPTCAVQ